MERSEQQIKIASDQKIILIGQTGAGKTTLINMMVNILGGVDYEGERKIAIPQDIKISSYDRKQSKTLSLGCNIGQFKGLQSEVQANQSSSQTQMPSAYKILDKSTNIKLTLIDTPGLSDTEGNNDQQHIGNIPNYLKAIEGVNTICLVNTGSQSRLSNSLVWEERCRLLQGKRGGQVCQVRPQRQSTGRRTYRIYGNQKRFKHNFP